MTECLGDSSSGMESTLSKPSRDVWNLLLVGDRRVGKTAFAHQLAYNTFEDTYYSTENEHRKTIQVDGMTTEVRILDSWVHQECYQEQPGTIRSGHAFILMYSTTQRITFEDVVGYCSCVRRTKSDPNTLFIIVGNKCDLVNKREVTLEEGVALANQLGCVFFETSAKTGENVQPVVTMLTRLLKDRNKEQSKFWDNLGKWWTSLCC